jgi:hypothetical protein
MPEAPATTKPDPNTPAATDPAPEPEPQGDPVDKPLGEGGEKALKAEREARAAAEKSAAALQKQLDDINAANLSDLEKAQKEATTAQETAAKAQAEALRYRVAAKNSISDEDAELFLTGTDEETLNKQAARLVEKAAANPSTPKPDLTQGGKPGENGSTPEADFASFLKGEMS